MKKDECTCGLNVCACEDRKAAIGDIAISGNRLQQVLASGVVSGRVAVACGELFTEIAELAGSVVPANDDGDT